MSALAWIQVFSRNWAVFAIAFTLITIFVVPSLVLMRYIRISLNIMRSTKPPLSRSPLDFEPLTGEPVGLTAFDGLRLAGMIIRASPRVARRGMVIFAHEFTSDMRSCARYCRPLREAGYDIFTFDFRGHGESQSEPDYTPRQWVTNRDLNDMRGAISFAVDWLEQRGLSPEVGLVGVSRGACAAILAAAEYPQVRAIIADGAFSTDSVIEYFMKRWAYIYARVRVLYENHHPLFWRFLRWAMIAFARREFRCTFPSVRKAILRMSPRPILFIHGEKDSYLPVEQTRRLYAIAAQPKYMWIAPAARHNQAVVLHPERYAKMTVDFFEQYLSGAEPTDSPVVLPTPPTVPSGV
ncbi:MAG: alpha/beta fold hydrolase [Phycisphaerae bacterium]